MELCASKIKIVGEAQRATGSLLKKFVCVWQLLLVLNNFYEVWKGVAEDIKAQISTFVQNASGDLQLAVFPAHPPSRALTCVCRGSARML